MTLASVIFTYSSLVIAAKKNGDSNIGVEIGRCTMHNRYDQYAILKLNWLDLIDFLV